MTLYGYEAERGMAREAGPGPAGEPARGQKVRPGPMSAQKQRGRGPEPVAA